MGGGAQGWQILPICQNITTPETCAEADEMNHKNLESSNSPKLIQKPATAHWGNWLKLEGGLDSQILHTKLHAFPLHLSSVKAWQCVNFTRKKLFRKPQSDNKNWHIPVKRWQPGGIGGQKSPNSLKYGAKGVHAMN